MKKAYVYILTNKTNRVLYTGSTVDLGARIWEHKLKLISGSFTKKYNVNKLVYFKVFDNVKEARKKEKQIKNWKRSWKIELINRMNPKWVDYFLEVNIQFRY